MTQVWNLTLIQPRVAQVEDNLRQSKYIIEIELH